MVQPMADETYFYGTNECRIASILHLKIKANHRIHHPSSHSHITFFALSNPHMSLKDLDSLCRQPVCVELIYYVAAESIESLWYAPPILLPILPVTYPTPANFFHSGSGNPRRRDRL